MQSIIQLTLILEIYQSLNMQASFYLSKRSKGRFSLYYLYHFFRQNLFTTFCFLLYSSYAISVSKQKLDIFYYVFSPLLLSLSPNWVFDGIMLFSPLILSYLNLSHYIILIFIIYYTFLLHHRYPRRFKSDSISSFLNIFNIVLPLLVLLSIFSINLGSAVQKQLLILLCFILMTQVHSQLLSNKKETIVSKNRYILWSLSSTHFNFKFLNIRLRKSIMQYSIFFLLIVFMLNIQNRFIVDSLLIMCLFLYLFLSELDYIVHYHYFNQSYLYDDLLSRTFFTQLVNSIIGLFLLYISVKEIILLRNLSSTYIPYIQLAFFFWLFSWFCFYILRYKKKICFRKSLVILILPLLLSCSKVPQETLVVVDSRAYYSGTMRNENTQEFLISDESQEIKVSHGQKINKGDILFTTVHPGARQDIDRINFQVEKLNTKLSHLKGLLKDEEKAHEAKIQIESVEEELSLLYFDRRQIQTTTHTKASFSGTTYIQDDTLKLVSDALALTLELTEHEFRHFKKIQDFDFMTLDKEIMSKGTTYIVEPENDLYIIQFDAFEHDCYVNQTLLISSSSPQYYIPQSFIRVDEDLLFVQTDSTEKAILGSYDDLKGNYLVSEGIESGDVLYEYVNQDQ